MHLLQLQGKRGRQFPAHENSQRGILEANRKEEFFPSFGQKAKYINVLIVIHAQKLFS